jgi:hypothetical protein
MAAMPKTLGGLEKRYVELETRIDDLKREAKKLEAEQEEVLLAIASACKAQRIESHRGGRYLFAEVETEYAKTEDFKRVIAHVVETGEYDLLSDRVKVTAARERWAQGITVPGVVRVATREWKARALPKRSA